MPPRLSITVPVPAPWVVTLNEYMVGGVNVTLTFLPEFIVTLQVRPVNGPVPSQPVQLTLLDDAVVAVNVTIVAGEVCA